MRTNHQSSHRTIESGRYHVAQSRDRCSRDAPDNRGRVLQHHGFTALPVDDGADKYLGLIYQIHLIQRGRDDAVRLNRGFGAAMARLIDPQRAIPVRAVDILSGTTARAVRATPVVDLFRQQTGCFLL